MKIKFLENKAIGVEKAPEKSKALGGMVPKVYKKGETVAASELPKGWADAMVESGAAEKA